MIESELHFDAPEGSSSTQNYARNYDYAFSGEVVLPHHKKSILPSSCGEVFPCRVKFGDQRSVLWKFRSEMVTRIARQEQALYNARFFNQRTDMKV